MSTSAITTRRRPSQKFDARRLELVRAAQATLADRGYAETSLRDIATNSEFSHGVLHYYFADKDELITLSVQIFKETCARRFDDVVAAATTPDELSTGFREVLVASLVDDGPLHRVWYDLRNQSMFDPTFREMVRHIDQLLEEMTWNIVSRYAELSGSTPAIDSKLAYALLDGMFLQAIIAQAAGDDRSEQLGDNGVALLHQLA